MTDQETEQLEDLDVLEEPVLEDPEITEEDELSYEQLREKANHEAHIIADAIELDGIALEDIEAWSDDHLLEYIRHGNEKKTSDLETMAANMLADMLNDREGESQ